MITCFAEYCSYEERGQKKYPLNYLKGKGINIHDFMCPKRPKNKLLQLLVPERISCAVKLNSNAFE